jgi:cytochrome c oxidase subunit 1
MHLQETYFVIAHFHYIMVGGQVMAFLGGLHYWWPKISGRMYPEWWGRIAAVVLFIGFNMTFLPQFVLGYWGMPRRYPYYAPEFQMLNILSTAGTSTLGLGYLLPFTYLFWSLKHGAVAGPNPWRATGLEWQSTSPPPTFNFDRVPVVITGPYAYNAEMDEIEDNELALANARKEIEETQARLAEQRAEREESRGGV